MAKPIDETLEDRVARLEHENGLLKLIVVTIWGSVMEEDGYAETILKALRDISS